MPQQKKKTTSTKKRKSKSNLKKGKVHIPAFKVIALCAAVIAVCMGLLLITTIATPEDNSTGSIAERFEEKNSVTEAVTATPSSNKTDSTKVTATSKPTANSNKQSSTSKPTETSTKQNTASKTTASTTKQNSSTKTGADTSSSATSSKPAASAASTQTSQSSNTASKPAATVATTKPDTATSKPTQTNTKPEPVNVPVTPKPTPQATNKYNFPKAVNNAQLVFLFDDGGQSISDLDKFLKLPFPITIAVLPRLTHSKDSAQKIRQAGKELMLHQPMQAINTKINPGPGAITPDMTESQIKSTLFQNINEIGPIAGINNHEGSMITADAEKMAVIMQYTSEQGIYFLDSRTNIDTQVPYVAKEMGYYYYERNGRFLDNEKTKQNALVELKKNLDIANKTGVVIMIAHIWSADFLPDFLMEVYPELVQQGYTFTTVSNCKGRKK